MAEPQIIQTRTNRQNHQWNFSIFRSLFQPPPFSHLFLSETTEPTQEQQPKLSPAATLAETNNNQFSWEQIEAIQTKIISQDGNPDISTNAYNGTSQTVFGKDTEYHRIYQPYKEAQKKILKLAGEENFKFSSEYADLSAWQQSNAENVSETQIDKKSNEGGNEQTGTSSSPLLTRREAHETLPTLSKEQSQFAVQKRKETFFRGHPEVRENYSNEKKIEQITQYISKEASTLANSFLSNNTQDQALGGLRHALYNQYNIDIQSIINNLPSSDITLESLNKLETTFNLLLENIESKPSFLKEIIKFAILKIGRYFAWENKDSNLNKPFIKTTIKPIQEQTGTDIQLKETTEFAVKNKLGRIEYVSIEKKAAIESTRDLNRSISNWLNDFYLKELEKDFTTDPSDATQRQLIAIRHFGNTKNTGKVSYGTAPPGEISRPQAVLAHLRMIAKHKEHRAAQHAGYKNLLAELYYGVCGAKQAIDSETDGFDVALKDITGGVSLWDKHGNDFHDVGGLQECNHHRTKQKIIPGTALYNSFEQLALLENKKNPNYSFKYDAYDNLITDADCVHSKAFAHIPGDEPFRALELRRLLGYDTVMDAKVINSSTACRNYGHDPDCASNIVIGETKHSDGVTFLDTDIKFSLIILSNEEHLPKATVNKVFLVQRKTEEGHPVFQPIIFDENGHKHHSNSYINDLQILKELHDKDLSEQVEYVKQHFQLPNNDEPLISETVRLHQEGLISEAAETYIKLNVSSSDEWQALSITPQNHDDAFRYDEKGEVGDETSIAMTGGDYHVSKIPGQRDFVRTAAERSSHDSCVPEIKQFKEYFKNFEEQQSEILHTLKDKNITAIDNYYLLFENISENVISEDEAKHALEVLKQANKIIHLYQQYKTDLVDASNKPLKDNEIIELLLLRNKADSYYIEHLNSHKKIGNLSEHSQEYTKKLTEYTTEAKKLKSISDTAIAENIAKNISKNIFQLDGKISTTISERNITEEQKLAIFKKMFEPEKIKNLKMTFRSDEWCLATLSAIEQAQIEQDSTGEEQAGDNIIPSPNSGFNSDRLTTLLTEAFSKLSPDPYNAQDNNHPANTAVKKITESLTHRIEKTQTPTVNINRKRGFLKKINLFKSKTKKMGRVHTYPRRQEGHILPAGPNGSHRTPSGIKGIVTSSTFLAGIGQIFTKSAEYMSAASTPFAGLLTAIGWQTSKDAAIKTRRAEHNIKAIDQKMKTLEKSLNFLCRKILNNSSSLSFKEKVENIRTIIHNESPENKKYIPIARDIIAKIDESKNSKYNLQLEKKDNFYARWTGRVFQAIGAAGFITGMTTLVKLTRNSQITQKFIQPIWKHIVEPIIHSRAFEIFSHILPGVSAFSLAAIYEMNAQNNQIQLNRILQTNSFDKEIPALVGFQREFLQRTKKDIQRLSWAKNDWRRGSIALTVMGVIDTILCCIPGMSPISRVICGALTTLFSVPLLTSTFNLYNRHTNWAGRYARSNDDSHHLSGANYTAMTEHPLRKKLFWSLGKQASEFTTRKLQIMHDMDTKEPNVETKPSTKHNARNSWGTFLYERFINPNYSDDYYKKKLMQHLANGKPSNYDNTIRGQVAYQMKAYTDYERAFLEELVAFNNKRLHEYEQLADFDTATNTLKLPKELETPYQALLEETRNAEDRLNAANLFLQEFLEFAKNTDVGRTSSAENDTKWKEITFKFSYRFGMLPYALTRKQQKDVAKQQGETFTRTTYKDFGHEYLESLTIKHDKLAEQNLSNIQNYFDSKNFEEIFAELFTFVMPDLLNTEVMALYERFERPAHTPDALKSEKQWDWKHPVTSAKNFVKHSDLAQIAGNIAHGFGSNINSMLQSSPDTESSIRKQSLHVLHA